MYDKDERVRFTFRLPATLLEKMKIIASIEGSSMNSLILHILWDYIKEIENKEVK
ncbi:TPA: Arc family DNA-binding protein [Clostridioides difficile]|nr:Arc family DNA-binding protein [Clostridioides difficile]